jgi:hypothetical protein
MIIIKEEPLTEESQLLNEMATVCQKADGYGMIIEVNSDDHGFLGNKTQPAHAHLKSIDGVYLGKFAITHQPPRGPQHIFDCDKKHLIPASYKAKIVKWAGMKNRETGGSNWAALRWTWKILHP